MGRKQFIGSDIGSQDFFKDQTRLVFTRDFRLNLFVRILVFYTQRRNYEYVRDKKYATCLVRLSAIFILQPNYWPEIVTNKFQNISKKSVSFDSWHA